MSPIRTTVIGAVLGRLYFSVLLDHLRTELSKPEDRREITIRYGELVERTKQRYSTEPCIAAAIPTNIGSRLLVVQRICERLGLPNLACLGVNADGMPGVGYVQGGRNWAMDKAEVLTFDWDSVHADVAATFEVVEKDALTRAEKKKRRTLSDQQARELLWEAAKASPGAYKVNDYQKEAMIKLIMGGLSVDEAYAEVTE